MNIGMEYMGYGSLGPWRDTQCYVTGPIVQCLQICYCEDWYWTAHQIPELFWQHNASPSTKTQATAQTAIQTTIASEKASSERLQHRRVDTQPLKEIPALVIPSGPADEQDTMIMTLLYCFGLAKQRIWFASPYFVPGPEIISALTLALLRGIELRVLIPEKPDHRLVSYASYASLKQLHRLGAKIYRYQSGFLHQKVLLIDERISLIGTANMDNRSHRLNFELSLFLYHEQTAQQVACMLENDFRASNQIDINWEYRSKSSLFRLAVRFARLLSPIL